MNGTLRKAAAVGAVVCLLGVLAVVGTGAPSHAQDFGTLEKQLGEPIGTLESGVPIWQDSGAIIAPDAEAVVIESTTDEPDSWGIISSILLALVYLIREVSAAVERSGNGRAAAHASQRRHELEKMRLTHLLASSSGPLEPHPIAPEEHDGSTLGVQL